LGTPRYLATSAPEQPGTLRINGDLPTELEMPKNHQENRQTEKTTEKDNGDFEKRTEKIPPQTCSRFRADP
jgi:hypothetical protein